MQWLHLPQPFPQRRLFALAAIAFIAIGLGVVRLAPGSGRLAVPRGAHAGQIVMKPCT